jgi:hypothetical protein
MDRNVAFYFYVLFLIRATDLYSQKPQLSLKAGTAKTFAAPFKISEGYAYRNYSKLQPFPTLSIEYSGKSKEKSFTYLAGISFQPVVYSGGFNYRNIQPSSVSRAGQVVAIVTLLYAGMERGFCITCIRNYRNYFTWVAGIGINFSGLYGESEIFSTEDIANTYDGKRISGIKLSLKRANWYIAPTVFTGIRYHIRRKKDSHEFSLELIANYGITRYFDYAVQYKIDGELAEDRLGEKGFNIQFNVKIPLVTFGKKKKLINLPCPRIY